MEQSYRIKAEVGQDSVVKAQLKQDVSFLEILSLKIGQSEIYKQHTSNYGVIVGRVLANDAFGIPNAKVSVFIELTEEDKENFQTIFAKNEGAVSAPAAGLHFSRELFNRMILKDINKAFITLHMGIGHFREVDVEDLSKHKMDSERLIISEEAAALINKTKREKHKVLAVGITTIRGLETYVTTNDEVNAYDGWTNKFIFPPYRFAIPDAIVSNFHRPGSTMLMSVAAFGGYENVMKAYKMALEGDYKFGPYGDALLII